MALHFFKFYYSASKLIGRLPKPLHSILWNTLKQIQTYVKPILNDDTPDPLILHIGCNDIGNKQLTENEIAEWIVKIGRQCKENNVNDVFILSLTCRTQKN